ncbi:MAG TPA: RluA family pseudouridine synthase [Candidatus Saccharimonadales bacterium]|nr:RluA family pseudouridine synthase [Candidatus Saccharimonadales bacterium]
MQYIADQNKERVDAFLARINPEYSRSFWQKLCEQEQVSVNGKPAKSSIKLTQGNQITVILPEKKDFSEQTLPILYQDNDVIVLNKPAGILTHAKGALSNEFTVGEFMCSHSSDNQGNRPGIVHRLDRGTSGVIIAAKTPEAKRWLQKQFATRKVKKTYTALVQGYPKEPNATLDLPIGRNPKKPQTFKVTPNGKPAQTDYAVVKTFKNNTLVELKPLTGRTHQLRVHMQYLGCPIVGDPLYGKPNEVLGRMFLHAASLELTLPNRERRVFKAPLPKELQTFLETLV